MIKRNHRTCNWLQWQLIRLAFWGNKEFCVGYNGKTISFSIGKVYIELEYNHKRELEACGTVGYEVLESIRRSLPNE